MNDVTSACLEAQAGASLAVTAPLCILTERLLVGVYIGAHLAMHDVYVFLSNGLLRFTREFRFFSQGPPRCSPMISMSHPNTALFPLHQQRLYL